MNPLANLTPAQRQLLKWGLPAVAVAVVVVKLRGGSATGDPAPTVTEGDGTSPPTGQTLPYPITDQVLSGGGLSDFLSAWNDTLTGLQQSIDDLENKPAPTPTPKPKPKGGYTRAQKGENANMVAARLRGAGYVTKTGAQITAAWIVAQNRGATGGKATTTIKFGTVLAY